MKSTTLTIVWKSFEGSKRLLRNDSIHNGQCPRDLLQIELGTGRKKKSKEMIRRTIKELKSLERAEEIQFE